MLKALPVILFFLCAAPAAAQTTPSPAPAAPLPNLGNALQALSGNPAPPQPYASFIRGATVQDGFIPIVKKSGRVYLALSTAQLNKDFIETSVPSTGLGGFGPAQGEPYVAPARILRFERVDDNVVIRWPNTFASVRPNTPEATGVSQSLPSSVVAVTPVVAQDENTVVIAATPFLGDVADFARATSRGNPLAGLRLDPTRSFFASTKAFPKNDVLRVDQTWTGTEFSRIDNVPDIRSIEVIMTYNLIEAPHDGYMPRFADPRVGYFTQPLINFAADPASGRNLFYIVRWNLMPAQPGRPSVATNPIVFYLSSDIPTAYRETVRQALLTWNDAFRHIGILNAVQVKQQPSDPNWDPEDLSHNMVRWIDTSSPQYGAEALIVTDPRTGEELNVGVNVDAVEGLQGRTYRYLIAPARGLADSASLERAYTLNAIRGVILHESGHDLGLQHNFIGSTAYSPKQVQSKVFTSKYGIANSVMEYNPVNVWPKGTPQGDYNQIVLGPYDYYAMRYGYAYIPNARSPQDELPTLHRWASAWQNPRYRFAGDEDNSYGGGHAIDPRVVTYDLTNRPLQWCAVQMNTMHRVMNAVAARFPQRGQSYDEARRAFLLPLTPYLRCASLPAHTIGGEYISRSAKGDPGAGTPLSAVPRADEYAAWKLLSTGLFGESAWHFNPSVLRMLTYSEYGSLSGGSWAYVPQPRHDVDVTTLIGAAQENALNELFAPLRLARIDDLQTKYGRGVTMTLSDLFDWTRDGIFGDLATGAVENAGPIRRNLQIAFAKRLADMWISPASGTPYDAQALARLQLANLRDAAAAGLRRNISELARAHLEALSAIATQALDAKPIIFPTLRLNVGGFNG